MNRNDIDMSVMKESRESAIDTPTVPTMTQYNHKISKLKEIPK
jgi:hypothetical protein